MFIEITGKTLGDFNPEETRAQSMSPRRKKRTGQ